MNTKRLITASIFSLISASTALAADVLIPHQTAPSTPSSTIVAPTFSWTGLYLGVQAGGFSSKSDMALVDQEKGFPLDKEFSPKLSGFAGGFYAGSNIDLGDSFIFGIDTDLMISGKKHTKTINIGTDDNVTVEKSVGRFRKSIDSSSTSSQTGTQVQSVPKVPEATSTPTQSAASQLTQAQAGQPNRSAATGNSGNVNSTTAGKVEGTSGVPTPSSKTQSASPAVQPVAAKQVTGTVSSSSAPSARTDARQPSVAAGGNGSSLAASKPTPTLTGTGAGSQTSGVRASGASASTKSAEVGSAKPAEKAPVSSVPSTKSETSQTAVKSPTSGQSSSAARTVPSGGPLTLARSGSSNGSETKASNGTSGTQHGGHHSAHGSGHSNPHGASHPGGHGSGVNPHGSHGANPHASRPHGAQSVQAADKSDSSVYGIEQMKKMASELGLEQGDEVETLNHTFKQNWGGATRVRIGFAADRFMPYLAGGIAYGQFQDTVSVSVKGEDGTVVSSRNLTDETKTMIGYTLGGGVDFSVLDNVIVRAEYRYSDFGKKKLAKEKLEINYKTNDFRVGVAYKF
ncbi:outer membrane protein [Bartonella krasnovii]|uniref:outer membrane protein n=1 Tax=Bartonella krasnovii TaxID=2267275 RepID=UPI001F4D27D6|nr:outer membrane protein [Bartonella krasnovii]UNF47248.1 outer membrane beta-barrel protein [Bartonella krasnovii]